jgi:hypothetical protein
VGQNSAVYMRPYLGIREKSESAHRVYSCVSCFHNKQRLFLNRVNRMGFVIEFQCVFCDVEFKFIKIIIIWDMTPCCLVGLYRRFGGKVGDDLPGHTASHTREQ